MGTETIKSILIKYSEKCLKVKLNNPLMGTETVDAITIVLALQ